MANILELLEAAAANPCTYPEKAKTSDNDPPFCYECPSCIAGLGLLAVRRVEIRMRRFKRMAVEMRKMIPLDAIEDGVSRASGEVACGLCGLPYYDHPESTPTFHLRCDGRTMKV